MKQPCIIAIKLKKEAIMVGKKFGKLTVLEKCDFLKSGHKVYKCKCDCGNESFVLATNLKTGNSKSCGCVTKEKSSERMSKLNFRHGETNTKLWKTWHGIVERTTIKTSSHYFRYGAKGLGIFKDWLTYENFANYIGQPPSQKHSIDRIDNNKGYEPGNIRWATAKEQASNRITNKKIYLDDKIYILSDAAKKLGISKSTMSRWYKSGKFKKVE